MILHNRYIVSEDLSNDTRWRRFGAVLRMSFIGSLGPYPTIIRGAVGVSQKSKFSARVYAFTLVACCRSRS